MYNTTVTLKKGEGRTLKAGGMWVFDNEIASILGTFENGDIVNIHDFDGYFMGYGYINTNSKITLRLLARRKDTVIDEAFFEQRVRDAWNYRKETIDTSSCRLIFGEADFLPGIVIDKFTNRGIQILGMIVGTAICYAFGTAWFCLQAGYTVGAALAVCVIPFIPADLCKMVIAMIIGPMVRKRLGTVAQQ